MALRTVLTSLTFAGALTLAAGVVASPAALAQHVVTDDEAGKLTFDALTATPAPVYRRVVAYRAPRSTWAPAYHAAMYHARYARAVRTVDYRRAAYHEPRFAVVSHKRRRG